MSRRSCREILIFIALYLTPAVSAHPGLWDFPIFKGPAPPPEEGPPLSRNASRDPALLPYQICGIVGGYLGFTGITLLLLMTVGRRARRNAQQSSNTLEIEMVKTNPRLYDPSPASPSSIARSWLRSPFKKSTFSNPASPTMASVASFDANIVHGDKDYRQKEMERLYAAVMEHDAKKSQLSVNQQERSSDDDLTRPTSRGTTASRKAESMRSARGPPAPLVTRTSNGTRLEVPSQRSYPASPVSPMSPRSPIRAIYPPDSPATFHYDHPTSPIRARYPSLPSNPTPQARRESQEELHSPRSILSRKSRPGSVASTSSAKSKGRALKNIRISGPVNRYPGSYDNDDESRTPLTPRFTNLPPPPLPPTEPSSPTTPGTTYSYEGLDKPQPLPRAIPHRGGAATPGKSGAPSGASLPLRAFETDDVGPLPSTKTTYVERRMEKLSLTTPRTGVPATPYSAYMPFTPITPVTPHLVGRKERKIMEKGRGKRVKDHETDFVKGDDDLWDTGL